MDVLYIPQLDDGDPGESPTAGRYRILKRTPEGGVVALSDRAVTRVEVATADPLKLVMPPLVKGAVRDFFVRLVVTADEVPELTFAPPAGETLSFEDVDQDVFMCDVGVNVYAFTETDEGVFIVNRKRIDIDWEVTFDPCGGEMAETSRVYRLGAPYASLPIPVKDGFVFTGWYVAEEGGVAVVPEDRCKTGVTALRAQWDVYVDPFVDAICPAKNLTFISDSSVPWRVDAGTFVSSPGSARSGAIGHNGVTAIRTVVEGRGTISFSWKASSEYGFDILKFMVDDVEASSVSGKTAWATYSKTLSNGGTHIFEWRYQKDGSVSEGSDCAWIDNVVWTPEA